ncbi:GNAT family N-acetyltransferase [Jatrophihabitans sp. YIM 134969]
MPVPDIAASTTRLGPADAGEVLTLQLAAWVQEAHANDTLAIPPLHETLADVERDLADDTFTVWGVRDHGRLTAMVRTSLRDAGRTAFVGRLGVVPDRQGHGLGAAVLAWAEAHVPESVTRFELITGALSSANHAFYARQGYRPVPDADGPEGTTTFVKDVSTSR